MQNDKPIIRDCPCCSSKIKGGVQLTGFYHMNVQFIQCDACGLKMESKYIIDGMSQTHLRAITEDLIRKWNTRKPMERIVEQLEKELELSKDEVDRCVVKALPQYDRAIGYERAIDNALDIVRKGGVDNAG